MTHLPQKFSHSLSLANYVSHQSVLSRKNELSRIHLFEHWLVETGQTLFTADLRAYCDYLIGPDRGLKPSSANAHLKSIRGRYRVMMRSNTYRNALSQIVADVAQRDGLEINSLADQLALMNELEKRIENHIFASDVFAREITYQDVADEDSGLRLTQAQALQLIRTPNLNTLRGRRDAALIALMICTGIREHEVVALKVADLRVHYDKQLALRVREGKGAKQRVVVYGTLAWCLEYVNRWLQDAGITSGAIFRGFWGASTQIRPTAMSVRTVARILSNYPVLIDGEQHTVRPHDLRRTYARIQHDSGMKAEALQQNMGHAAYDTTLGYIGDLDADARKSRATLPMPHAAYELKVNLEDD